MRTIRQLPSREITEATCVAPWPLLGRLTALNLKLRALRLAALLDLHGYNPGQPRVPAGNSDGGQWTSGGAAGGVTSAEHVDVAQNDRRAGTTVNLVEEEARGGHAIRKHVGQADDQLIAVLNRNYFVGLTTYSFQDAEGTFDSVADADFYVNRTLAENPEFVARIASGEQVSDPWIQKRFGFPTGREAFRPNVDSEPIIRPTYEVRVVIRHDPGSRRGFRVVTAFPLNRRQSD